MRCAVSVSVISPHKLAAFSRLPREHIVTAFGNEVRRNERKGSDENDDNRDDVIERKHKHERACDRYDSAEKLRKA